MDRMQCPRDTKFGDIVCRGGQLWQLTYSECAPPGQRQCIGECDHPFHSVQSHMPPMASTDPHKMAQEVAQVFLAAWHAVNSHPGIAIQCEGDSAARIFNNLVGMIDAIPAAIDVLAAESERQRAALREIVSQCHNLPRGATADRIESLARVGG